MRLRCSATTAIVILAMFLAPVFAGGGNDGLTKIEGFWQGPLKVRANLEITIVFHVFTKPDGTLAATMDVPIQQVKDLPVDAVSCDNGRLRFEVKRIGGVFEGQLAEDESTAVGQWTQGPGSLPLKLKPQPMAVALLIMSIPSHLN